MDVIHQESSTNVRRRRQFWRELGALGLPTAPGPGTVVTASDVARLPRIVRRYLGFMGVVGREREGSFRIRSRGLFRRAPTAPWSAVEAWQCCTSPVVSRFFEMWMRAGPLSLVARDTYVAGHGRMVGRLLDWIPVVEDWGPKLDTGELVTVLNDYVLFAPSMLLVPAVRFDAIDDRSFDVSLKDADRLVRARVFVEEDGAPVSFETTDRFCALDGRGHPGPLVRTRWTTPIAGWDLSGERPRPTQARAIWHLRQGPFCYADFSFDPATTN